MEEEIGRGPDEEVQVSLSRSVPSGEKQQDAGGTGSVTSGVEDGGSDSLSEREYSSSSDSGKGGSGTEDAAVAQHVAIDPEGMWGGIIINYNPIPAYCVETGKEYPDLQMIFEFEIAQEIVGRLIGKNGSFVNMIRKNTRATIIVKNHHVSAHLKICVVQGNLSEIDKALRLIRERFSPKKFPFMTLAQINFDGNGINPIHLPSTTKLNLIEGVVNDIGLSCVVSLEHMFFQHPTHPTYPALARLHIALKALYDVPNAAPQLLRPFYPGLICVAQVKEEWFRCEVISIDDDNDLVTARLVDVGGYFQIPVASLRQIRLDFVTIPFQSTECRLANVIPANQEEGWSQDSVNFFKILSQGHVLQATVVGYSARDNVTLVHLYKVGENNSHTFINRELVNHGYGRWIEPELEYFYPTADELALTFGDLDVGGGVLLTIEDFPLEAGEPSSGSEGHSPTAEGDSPSYSPVPPNEEEDTAASGTALEVPPP